MDHKPSSLEAFFARYPLYFRIGFGFIILFGMVGNCSGHSEGAVYVFIMTAVVWTCLRIIQEAIEAWAILRMAARIEEEYKRLKAEQKAKPSSKDEDPEPPAT